MRAAFADRAIRRGIIVVEGNTIACQTWIEGTFVREFTQSPEGPIPPNGRRIVFDLMNIFEMDDDGRLAEEYVRSDNRSLLEHLRAPARPEMTELTGNRLIGPGWRRRPATESPEAWRSTADGWRRITIVRLRSRLERNHRRGCLNTFRPAGPAAI